MKTHTTTWKRKIEIINKLKSRVNSIFRDGREGHRTHNYILDRIQSEVWNHKDKIFMTGLMRAEINGYIWANFYMMYNYVEWVHWYKGKFVGKNLPYGDNFDQNSVESAHCYKSTEDIYTERKKA